MILNAPAVFRFTAAANPGRHLAAAEALGADDRQRRSADAGEILADRITWFMQRLNVPNGLRAVGYTSADIPALVEGTLPQHRVTKLSPRPAGPEELARTVRACDGRLVDGAAPEDTWTPGVTSFLPFSWDGSSSVRSIPEGYAAEAPRVVILDEQLAARFWPNRGSDRQTDVPAEQT